MRIISNPVNFNNEWPPIHTPPTTPKTNLSRLSKNRDLIPLRMVLGPKIWVTRVVCLISRTVIRTPLLWMRRLRKRCRMTLSCWRRRSLIEHVILALLVEGLIIRGSSSTTTPLKPDKTISKLWKNRDRKLRIKFWRRKVRFTVRSNAPSHSQI